MTSTTGDSALLDRPRAVRRGEELNREALQAWLAAELGLTGEIVVEQFPSGHSNLTYSVRTKDTDLVLRRPPFGAKIASAHDMAREHRVLSALSAAWPKAPRPRGLCEDESVLGAPFYVVERVRGLILRRDPPPGFNFDATAAQTLSEAFVDTLVELHSLDPAAVGLGDLGHPDGYVMRQVQGWTQRYEKARTDAVDDVERVAKWLAEQPPVTAQSPDVTLLHNDYKYDNLVLDPENLGQVRAVLDWEMATRGDPLMDLGTALCYWVDVDDAAPLVELRFGPTHASGSLDRNAIVERYAQKTGRNVDNIAFYYVFGLFKTAVVVQQIYARYVAGHTTDPRFATMIDAVRALSAQACRVIDQGGRLDPTE